MDLIFGFTLEGRLWPHLKQQFKNTYNILRKWKASFDIGRRRERWLVVTWQAVSPLDTEVLPQDQKFLNFLISTWIFDFQTHVMDPIDEFEKLSTNTHLSFNWFIKSKQQEIASSCSHWKLAISQIMAKPCCPHLARRSGKGEAKLYRGACKGFRRVKRSFRP